MPNEIATVSQSGWVITPDIQGLETEFVASLVKVTSNLTDSVRLIRAIQDSKSWKTGHYIVEGEDKKPVFGDFWEQYVPWLLATNQPTIGMEHKASWFRARLRWWKYVEEKGRTLEEAMTVPLQVQYALEKVIDTKTDKFKLLASDQPTDGDTKDAVDTLIDDVLDGKYTASQLTKMVEWQGLEFFSDGKTVTVVLEHATKGTIRKPLFTVKDKPEELMDALTIKLRIREATAEYEPGEENMMEDRN